MTRLCKALPLILALLAAFTALPLAAQATDCSFTLNFTGDSTKSAPNLSQNTPCVNWRITFSTAAGMTVTAVTFQTSPDNSTWTNVPNTVCSSSVQPPCIIQGTNPLTGTTQGMSYFSAYGAYVQVVVSGTNATGTGTVRGYGAKGATASAPPGSGTTGGGISGLAAGTIPIATSGTALGNSPITDNGTTITVGGSRNLSIGTGVPGGTAFSAGPFASPASDYHWWNLWKDSTGANGFGISDAAANWTFANHYSVWSSPSQATTSGAHIIGRADGAQTDMWMFELASIQGWRFAIDNAARTTLVKALEIMNYADIPTVSAYGTLRVQANGASTLQAESTGASAAILDLKNTAGHWQMYTDGATGELSIADAASATYPVSIAKGAPTAALAIGATGAITTASTMSATGTTEATSNAVAWLKATSTGASAAVMSLKNTNAEWQTFADGSTGDYYIANIKDGVYPFHITRAGVTTVGALSATGGSTGKATCWKAGGVIGYCSSAVGADGSCTCN